MKFAIVSLFTLALVLGAQASIIPWGNVITELAGGPLSYTAVTSPILPAWPAAVPIVAAAPASYVAKTRGAVHAAPLEGHLNSVANINVAPAPGTW
ncbi:adult cuticle protein 1-like [Calliphora vicina]|uniref:adult cuticle protein 1-like n=1 Tax=Calliphora vicina TaxID=7373 RepID=UPI00325A80FD